MALSEEGVFVVLFYLLGFGYHGFVNVIWKFCWKNGRLAALNYAVHWALLAYFFYYCDAGQITEDVLECILDQLLGEALLDSEKDPCRVDTVGNTQKNEGTDSGNGLKKKDEEIFSLDKKISFMMTAQNIGFPYLAWAMIPGMMESLLENKNNLSKNRYLVAFLSPALFVYFPLVTWFICQTLFKYKEEIMKLVERIQWVVCFFSLMFLGLSRLILGQLWVSSCHVVNNRREIMAVLKALVIFSFEIFQNMKERRVTNNFSCVFITWAYNMIILGALLALGRLLAAFCTLPTLSGLAASTLIVLTSVCLWEIQWLRTIRYHLEISTRIAIKKQVASLREESQIKSNKIKNLEKDNRKLLAEKNDLEADTTVLRQKERKKNNKGTPCCCVKHFGEDHCKDKKSLGLFTRLTKFRFFL